MHNKEVIMMTNHPCPCCGFHTLSEMPPGTFAICPVCYWEDDYAQYNNPDLGGGANQVSLRQARINFAEYGASSKQVRKFVRKPRREEVPPYMHDI